MAECLPRCMRPKVLPPALEESQRKDCPFCPLIGFQVHCSCLSIMLWHKDTWSSKPCPYLLSHLLVFNDSLAIPTASFFFLFSTYSTMAGCAGFSRQLPLLLLLWEFKVLLIRSVWHWTHVFSSNGLSSPF